MYNAYRHNLFKHNKITHKKKIKNLCVLLSKHHSCCIELLNNNDANLIIKDIFDFINKEINDKNYKEQVWYKYLTDIVF